MFIIKNLNAPLVLASTLNASSLKYDWVVSKWTKS